jgi:hypothetical protein
MIKGTSKLDDVYQHHLIDIDQVSDFEKMMISVLAAAKYD